MVIITLSLPPPSCCFPTSKRFERGLYFTLSPQQQYNSSIKIPKYIILDKISN